MKNATVGQFCTQGSTPSAKNQLAGSKLVRQLLMIIHHIGANFNVFVFNTDLASICIFLAMGIRADRAAACSLLAYIHRQRISATQSLSVSHHVATS